MGPRARDYSRERVKSRAQRKKRGKQGGEERDTGKEDTGVRREEETEEKIRQESVSSYKKTLKRGQKGVGGKGERRLETR